MIAPLLALLLATPPIDAPLGVRTDGIFRELFLDMTAEDARPRPASFVARWTLANDWSAPTRLARRGAAVDVQADAQQDIVALALDVPWAKPDGPSWARRFATTVEARVVATSGGYTDGFVEGWHRLARFGNFDRGRYGRNGMHVRLRDSSPGGAVIDATSARAALGDAVVRQRIAIAQGGLSAASVQPRWGVSARLDLKLPFGDLERLGGSEGFDVGAALLGTTEILPWLTGHALLGLCAWSALPDAFPFQVRTGHAIADVSLVAHAGRWAFVIEDRLSSPAFESGWTPVLAPQQSARPTAVFALTRPHNQITGGVRYGAVTLWFAEDFTPGDPGGTGERWFYNSNSPDIALGLTVAAGL